MHRIHKSVKSSRWNSDLMQSEFDMYRLISQSMSNFDVQRVVCNEIKRCVQCKNWNHLLVFLDCVLAIDIRGSACEMGMVGLPKTVASLLHIDYTFITDATRQAIQRKALDFLSKLHIWLVEVASIHSKTYEMDPCCPPYIKRLAQW